MSEARDAVYQYVSDELHGLKHRFRTVLLPGRTDWYASIDVYDDTILKCLNKECQFYHLGKQSMRCIFYESGVRVEHSWHDCCDNFQFLYVEWHDVDDFATLSRIIDGYKAMESEVACEGQNSKNL